MTTGTLATVIAAAHAVVGQHGQPGAMARRAQLVAELDAAGKHPAPLGRDLAVVIAAARWTDRYGRAGAGQALAVLEAAVRTHAEQAGGDRG